MEEERIDSGLVDRAIAFAVEKHSGTPRKGTKVPYIVHPMEAAAIVAGITDDQELIAAALLHDTLEDTETTFEELEKAFGLRVANLVQEESEDKQADKSPDSTWKDRKYATLKHLEAAGYDAKLLVLGDKLANIRAIQRDLKESTEKGEVFWNRFHQLDSAMHGWYYGSIANIILADPKLKGTQACRDFVELVRAVFGTGI